MAPATGGTPADVGGSRGPHEASGGFQEAPFRTHASTFRSGSHGDVLSSLRAAPVSQVARPAPCGDYYVARLDPCTTSLCELLRTHGPSNDGGSHGRVLSSPHTSSLSKWLACSRAEFTGGSHGDVLSSHQRFHFLSGSHIPLLGSLRRSHGHVLSSGQQSGNPKDGALSQ